MASRATKQIPGGLAKIQPDDPRIDYHLPASSVLVYDDSSRLLQASCYVLDFLKFFKTRSRLFTYLTDSLNIILNVQIF